MAPSQIPASPKAAALADLVECLQLLGSRPLKLIAETVQPAYCESPWDNPIWKFSQADATVIDKNLLPFPSDSFQFSIGNECSKQDFHVHAAVLEIYCSHFPMELFFEKDERAEKLAVPAGVLIVPPGVPHRIKLNGVTFVFQAAINGGQVHGDKTVLEPRATSSNR